MDRKERGARTLWGWPGPVWLVVLLAVYGRLLLHPALRPVFPENDLWNHPVRWSVAESLRQGLLPLWNPLTALGMPWLAQFQTEVLYPFTPLFALFGLDAWNAYSLLHLLLYAAGFHLFLVASGASRFWAGAFSALSLVTLCAFHHLGSNAPSDTMAWIPWVFWGLRRLQDRAPRAAAGLVLVTALQILAGYPQIVLWTWLFAIPYALFLGGRALLGRALPPLAAALAVTAAQWLPGLEYFGLHAVRRPAMPDNPHHVLPLANLQTLLDPGALAQGGLPDRLASPTFFYHNLYVGLLPLAAVLAGLFLLRRVHREGRFHLAAALAALALSFGALVFLSDLIRVPTPDVLEASKAWVMAVFFLLAAAARVTDSLLPRPGRWAWALLVLALLDPARAALFHPLERTLVPGDAVSREAHVMLRQHLHGGRLLALADRDEFRRLGLSGEWHRDRPVFKHFIPNTNLLEGVPVANGNGSTWPSQGVMNALLYFRNAHPYAEGNLLGMLGVDVLHLPAKAMPARYPRVAEIDGWGLYSNPGSVGERFFFTGEPRRASRKEAFEAFARGEAEPLRDLFLGEAPVSAPPRRPGTARTTGKSFLVPDTGSSGWLVRTQNAMPGWRAWVDGKPAPVLMADGILQAVPYPRGASQVVLRYEPASFRSGLFVSLMALAGLAFLRTVRPGVSRPQKKRRSLGDRL
jgi:hypothetical protein